jgi:hypothetical protein
MSSTVDIIHLDSSRGSISESPYPLPANQEERDRWDLMVYHRDSTLADNSACCQRLNLQHQLIVKAFDGKLCTVPVALKDTDWVLESGAGTGGFPVI